MKNNFFGIILAKKNSERLMNKNIKKINKYHLVEYPMIAMQKSKFISKFYLSSDSKKILNLGRAFSKCSIDLRPLKYCRSRSTSIDTIIYIIKKKKINPNDFVVLLEPTSPMTDYKDLNEVVNIVNKKRVKSLVSVGKLEASNPNYCFKINKKFFPIKKKIFSIRQNIKDYYFLDGSVYISKVSEIQKSRTFLTKNTLCHLFPKHKNLEIDDLQDFKIIKKLMS